MKKTIMYIRTSTNNQQNSIDDQSFICREYCRVNGIQSFEIITDMVSGAKDNRDGFNRVMEMVKNGSVETIIVSKIDRLARKIAFVCNALEMCKKHNVRLVSVKENIDSGHFTSVMLIQMLSIASQFEREMIVERVVSTKKHLKRNNRVLGNTKYGEANNNKEIAVNNEERKIVDTAVSLFNAGNNYSAVARIMNRSGYMTRCGGIFYPQTIKNIVLNAA